MTIEHRTFHNVEVRAGDTGPNGRPTVTLQAIKPYVVDDYGSVWMPDTFDTDVQGRMAADPDDTPALCWAHAWADPVGHGIDYTPTDDGPRLRFEFDEFDAVPRAKQADAQVRSRTIRDCSVGFSHTKRRDPTDEERAKWPGVTEVIYEAELDEVSLVLRGAVPGAKVLAVRSARSGEVVDLSAVEEIARRVVAGDIDQATADEMARLLSAPPAADPAAEAERLADDPDADLGLPPDPDDGLAELVAEAENILNRSR